LSDVKDKDVAIDYDNDRGEEVEATRWFDE
jgi:hypothetical protein